MLRRDFKTFRSLKMCADKKSWLRFQTNLKIHLPKIIKTLISNLNK